MVDRIEDARSRELFINTEDLQRKALRAAGRGLGAHVEPARQACLVDQQRHH